MRKDHAREYVLSFGYKGEHPHVRMFCVAMARAVCVYPRRDLTSARL